MTAYVKVCGRLAPCARRHLHGAGIRKPSQTQTSAGYSITSSARPSSASGKATPSDWAVLRLSIN